MTKPEWGKKHICTSCSAPFYDLKRKDIVCPSCGEALKQTTTKSRASSSDVKPVSKEAARPAVKEPEDVVEEEIEIDDEDLDDDDDDDIEDAAASDDDVIADDSALIDEDDEESLEALDDSEPA